MKFSELWLREWVDISLNAEELINQITMIGLEVNSVVPVAGAFTGVVIGKIISCNQHPNNNKLHITKVNIGNDRILNIICNTQQNCRQDLKVAVAYAGATLANYFKVKTVKLYGEISEGIICSFSNLGISDNCDEIIALPMDAPIGVDIREYLKLNDNIIDISVPFNRSDCFCIIGIARELTIAHQKTKLNIPNISPVVATIDDVLPIQVEVADACPRYICRIIKGIKGNSITPLWMKEKLRRCGISSKGAIIDITNYVLLELGQPIQVFDKDLIHGGIVVRMAKDGEMLTLTDETKIKLRTDTLVIADYNQTLAIGGIINGKYSEININTQNILLECAFFNPCIITAQAHYYGIYSDASHRYERGVDSLLQYKAMDRTTNLLLDICGGKAGRVIDITNEKMLPKRASIVLRSSKINNLIGYHINNSQVINILRNLGYEVTESEKQWKVVVPSWRSDIKVEENLIEELARIYGYNNIPDKPMQINLKMKTNDNKSKLSLKRVKTMLSDKGYHEVITYSFVDPKIQKLIHPDTKPLILSNPISNEMSVMRTSLWTGLLSTIVYNQNRQQNNIRIFETGVCFLPDIRANLGVRQDLMLAGAIFGNRYEEHWDLIKKNVDFYDMKGDLEAVLDLTGKLSKIEFRTQNIPALHLGQSAAMYLYDECIGYVGVISPTLQHQLELNSSTVLFELEWNKITDCTIPQIHKISRFPENRRAISIVVPEEVPVSDVLAVCKKISTKHIVTINLLDVYRGNNIASGYKSLTISLIIQNVTHTLEEEEITNTIAKYIKALEEQFHASLRN